MTKAIPLWENIGVKANTAGGESVPFADERTAEPAGKRAVPVENPDGALAHPAENGFIGLKKRVETENGGVDGQTKGAGI